MVPDIKMNYQKSVFDDEEIPEVEENRNIDWKFMGNQILKALLFPLAIVGIYK